jgi:hypothetical protein
MLNNTQKTALQVNEVNAISKTILVGDVARLENTRLIAEAIYKGYKWLKDAEGKTFLKDKAIGMDELIVKVYSFKKAYYYRLIQFAKAIEENSALYKEFLKQCKAIKEREETTSISMSGFLDYYKEASLESNEGEAPEVEAKEKTETTLVFTFKGEALNMPNVALRISNGELITKADKDAINGALAYLYDLVNEAPKVSEAKAKRKAKAEAKATKKGLTFQDVLITEDAELNFAD